MTINAPEMSLYAMASLGVRSLRWRWTICRGWALGLVLLATLVGALSMANGVHPASAMSFTQDELVCSDAHPSESDVSDLELCRFTQAVWQHAQTLHPLVLAMTLPFPEDWREAPHLRPPIARG